jgi:hypothetical protein
VTAPREFLNETQERFLKAVLTKLPIEKIAELYLFQPIKQGGVESGVAVIASVPDAPPAPEPSAEASVDAGAVATQDSGDAGAAAELEVLDDAGAGAELGVVEESGDADADADAGADADAEAEAQAEPEAEADVDAEAEADAEVAAHGEIRAPGEDVAASTEAEELEALDDSGAGAELGVVEPDADAAADLADDFGDELGDVEPEPIDAGEEYPSQVAARYTVYSANYRLVLKGPDRGKWALDVKAEADAPLITLESVVRGVQQRSGDVEPPRRFEQAELRTLLRLPAADPVPGAPAAP